MLAQTPVVRFLEAMAGGLDRPAADGKNLKVNLVISDTGESYVLWIENTVLHHKKARPVTDANATLTLTKGFFIKMMAGTAGIKDTLLSDAINVTGSKIDLIRFFTLIDKAPRNFYSRHQVSSPASLEEERKAPEIQSNSIFAAKAQAANNRAPSSSSLARKPQTSDNGGRVAEMAE
jgi:hypothetical protein